MIKKVKSDPALGGRGGLGFPGGAVDHSASASPSLSRGRSAPCLARYGRSRTAARDPAIRSAIECKAKLVIFLALSVSNQTAFGNALTALDAALEVVHLSREYRGDLRAPEILRRFFTMVALEVVIFHVVGGGDAFHYAMCLLLADMAKRLV
jgi:hypothetical protein